MTYLVWFTESFSYDKFFFNKQFIHLVPPQPMLKRIKLNRWNEIQRESKGKMPSLIFRRGTKQTSLTITFCPTLKNRTSLARENIAHCHNIVGQKHISRSECSLTPVYTIIRQSIDKKDRRNILWITIYLTVLKIRWNSEIFWDLSLGSGYKGMCSVAVIKV